jgi:hypothetical protein
MNPNWAEENLQTIRTLMERSALYRRALAPIMLFAGIMGILAAGVGLFFHLDSPGQFVGLWLGTAVVAVIGALLIARRQALKDKDVFWSPPTRRVAQALAPPLTAGLILGVLFFRAWVFPPFIWVFFYGCALHAAGFFMSRGVRLFGWVYICLGAFVLAVFLTIQPKDFNVLWLHWFMGFFFGVLHLLYGVYLSVTEKGKNAA